MNEYKQAAENLGPWHYCWRLPDGTLTGTSAPNMLPDKMKYMLDAGGFSKPKYPEVLDVGANSGYISKWFADNRGSSVYSVEGGERFFNQLRFVVEVFNYATAIQPVYANIVNHTPPSSKFDLVLVLGVLHHIPQQHRVAVLKKCFDSMKQGAEIVVQTKSDMAVPDMLAQAGFSSIEHLCDMGHYNRTAWIAKKDIMKLPETEAQQILAALIKDDTDFKLAMFEALGEIVLALHWLRGTFWWLHHTGQLRFSDPQDEKNFMRLYTLGAEYEARLWSKAPPRAVLGALQEFRRGNGFGDELRTLVENISYDEHGRFAMEQEYSTEDLEDIMRRLTEVRRGSSDQGSY